LRQLLVAVGERILEIGFGAGRGLAALAASAGAAGRVYGLDLSTGMCAVARSRLRRTGVLHRTQLCAGDACALPFEDASLDAVFMCFTLELFDTPDLPVVLGECRRVLDPHGRMGVVSMLQQEQVNLPVRLYNWAHRALPALVDCRPIPAQALIEQAGFSVQTVAVISMWGLPVQCVMAKWD
ncbi:MAG: methyltransferase domain-containing protein, partial [Chloroflexi bacterium]|nr:methyltransferase domain-containing protein [Chloroflexota bacterium]